MIFLSSVGIYSLYVESQNLRVLYDLADNPWVVAIGEIGLDNTKNNFKEQRGYLIWQIIIANELHLPVIFHSSNCIKQVVDITIR